MKYTTRNRVCKHALDLAYARQHLFPEEFERAQDALRIISGGTLKGQVDHPSAHCIAALLDLLHDRLRTADEIGR